MMRIAGPALHVVLFMDCAMSVTKTSALYARNQQLFLSTTSACLAKMLMDQVAASVTAHSALNAITTNVVPMVKRLLSSMELPSAELAKLLTMLAALAHHKNVQLVTMV